MARPSTGSEVGIFNERVIAAHVSKEMPNIASLNVTKSSKVHIGPKIVTVSQTVQNNEMVKGQIFGLELVSIKTSKRLSCSVAIFLCWALVVASGLAIYLFYFVMYKHQVRLDIGLNETWYLRREEWQAMKSYGEDFLNLPVSYVIVGHSADYYCKEKYSCIKSMLNIQNDNFQRGFNDIVPNFLVGGNGFVFEGRGGNVLGAMAKYWNRISISVMFIGDYRTNNTDRLQLEHIEVLLKALVDKEILKSSYIVFGQCQVSPDTVSPGLKVVNNLKTLSHWNSTNKEKCLPG